MKKECLTFATAKNERYAIPSFILNKQHSSGESGGHRIWNSNQDNWLINLHVQCSHILLRLQYQEFPENDDTKIQCNFTLCT